IHTQILSAWVSSLGKQFVVYTFSYGTDFPVFQYVYVIDKAPHCNILSFYLFIIRLQSSDGTGAFLVSENSSRAPSADIGSDNFYFRYGLADTFHIVKFHIPITSFSKSFIGFTGFITSEKNGIGGESFKVGRHHIL